MTSRRRVGEFAQLAEIRYINLIPVRLKHRL